MEQLSEHEIDANLAVIRKELDVRYRALDAIHSRKVPLWCALIACAYAANVVLHGGDSARSLEAAIGGVGVVAAFAGAIVCALVLFADRGASHAHRAAIDAAEQSLGRRGLSHLPPAAGQRTPIYREGKA